MTVSWLLDTKSTDAMKILPICLGFFSSFYKGLSDDDVGVARGIVFQEVRPAAGFKIGECVEETLGVLP